MAVLKRGGVYWYEFIFKGTRYRESTHQANKNTARDMESARRSALAKGEVGILDKPAVPTFTEFSTRFIQAIETLNKGKEHTIKFYKERMRRLLDFQPLAGCRLDLIDEELIEKLKLARTRQVSRRGKPLAVASINRELVTLRRLLRLAHEWKVIDRLPKIRLFTGEAQRDFVLSYKMEDVYLHMAPQPLKDIALMILDTGARPGEACELEWKNVRLDPAPGSKYGYIRIVRGKSRNAKRNLSLTERLREMLQARQDAGRGGEYVFPAEDGGPWLVSSLDHQHTAFRALLGLPEEFVVHSLRHTMLTRLGEAGADAFTIMRIAGHSSVTVSQRYVHPSPESLETAFERMDTLNRAKRSEVSGVPTISTTVAKREAPRKSSNSHAINKMGA